MSPLDVLAEIVASLLTVKLAEIWAGSQERKRAHKLAMAKEQAKAGQP